MIRRVARIWKRGGGGYFERVRGVQTTLTRIFINLESVSDGLSKTRGEMSRKARKIKGFFSPKLGDLQKKKKSAISQIQTFEGGCFRMGAAIFHFSHKIGLKSTNNMRFCILHKPMGGARAPPAPPPPPWLRYWL